MKSRMHHLILAIAAVITMTISGCTSAPPSGSSPLSGGETLAGETIGTATGSSEASTSSDNQLQPSQTSRPAGGTTAHSSSGNSPTQGGSTTKAPSPAPKPTASGNPTVSVTNSLETVTETFTSSDTTLALFAAKGEAESAQLIIDGLSDGTLYLESSALSGPQTLPASAVQIRAAVFVRGKPEALIPVSYCPVKKGERTVVWITVQVPRDIKAGAYTGQITLYTADHQTAVPLTLTVADFALPETPSIPAAMGVWDQNLRKAHRLSETKPELIKAKQAEYFEFLLGYRMTPFFFDWYRPSMKINAYSIPGGVLDSSTLPYAKDPRLAALMLAYFPFNDDGFKEQMRFVKSNGLLDKSLFYLYDEVISDENVQLVKESAAAVKKVEPKARILTTFFCGPAKPGGNDQWYHIAEVPSVLRGATDVFCLATHASSKGDETVVDQVRGNLKGQEQFWTYVCNMPGGQYPNLHLDMTGFSQRAVIWRNYAEQAPGFLYWSVNHYNAPLSQPNDPGFYLETSELPAGDGILLYNGSMFPEYKYTGLVASVRLERLRDSLEDYEYFHKLEQVKGKKTAAASFKKIYVRPTGYMRQYANIEAVRREVASLITQ